MRAVQVPRMSEEQYFAFEASAEERHEWYRGDVFAMAGGSTNHNRIAGALYIELAAAARAGPCEVFFADVRLHMRACALYTYPDLMVVCGELHYAPGRTDTVTNPTLIAEVLSDSTEAYDRGKKWECYRSLDSLQVYLLVDQTRVHVEHFQRWESGWLLRTYDQEDDVLRLDTLGVEIPLARLYQRVEWESEQ